MSKDNTAPAFPAPASCGPFMGMTLREWYAGLAMQGICVSKDEAGTLLEHDYEWIAREASRIADAMLAERAKP